MVIIMKHILEMKYPSSWWHDLWREGLVTGNGYTGVNLYGGTKREVLQIGRHDFWYQGMEAEVPDVHEAFVRMRQKMDHGRYRDASWEIVKELEAKGYSSKLESHIPMARMVVEQTPIKGFKKFTRKLDMEQALASHQWMDGEVQMGREVFVSRATDAIVYRLTADATHVPESYIEYFLELCAYCNEGEEPTKGIQEIWDRASTKVQCEGEDTGYLYFNSTKGENGITGGDFGAVAKVIIRNGQMVKTNKGLKITGAREILITIRLYVNEIKFHAWNNLYDQLKKENEKFQDMLSSSVALHKPLYHSAEFTLSENTEVDEVWSRGNEELVMEAFSDKQPIELIEKLWHFGRYLFICGSDMNANPFPLYGLWGGNYEPLWCHNMANENLQMIYWHSLTGNLIGYNQAIFKYMNDRIPTFEENASKLFGIKGIYMTAGTTPGVATPTQVVPVIINWVGAAGWIAQHYYQYYLYTKDREYAQNVLLPYMEGVACFYEEFVQYTKEENGKERIRFYPSVSPENTPANFMPANGAQMAHPMPTTINATIDLAILKEFFTNMLKLKDSLPDFPFPDDRVRNWRRILDAIPNYQVNEDGAIREWQEEVFKDRYEHRHLSHIYPVFPGYEYYLEKDPEKMSGFIKAVKMRKIDAQTGWSLAHMAAIYARLRDGETAMECLDNMTKCSLLSNFFTLHNDYRGMNISLNMDPAPVQLDAIMGYVNAIQEMLLYVAPGYIALLPALEERLLIGEVKNFRYQDGFLTMKWNVTKKNFEAEITPIRPHKLQILMPEYVRVPAWVGIDSYLVKQLRVGLWELNLDTNRIKIMY